MSRVEKALEQYNFLFDNILELSKKMKDDYIETYVSIIPKKIDVDFKIIENEYDNNTKELFSNRFKYAFLKLFGIGKKVLENELALLSENMILTKDLEEFTCNFYSYSEDLKNKIVLDFELLLKLANDKKEDYRIIYALYQSILISIITMLPKNYRVNILSSKNFFDCKDEMHLFGLDDDKLDIDILNFYKNVAEEKLTREDIYFYEEDLEEITRKRNLN